MLVDKNKNKKIKNLVSRGKFFQEKFSRFHHVFTKIVEKIDMSASRKNMKTTPKKYNYKRKEGYKTPKMTMTNPKQLAQLAVEKKNFDASAQYVPAGANLWSQIIANNIILVGTSPTSRIGRKITMKSLYLRYRVVPSTDPAPSSTRILVVYDKQTNGALPVVTDILQTNEYNAPNNLSNMDRFITLVDIITQLPNSAQTVSGSEYRKINLDTVFNLINGGTVADINFGGVFILCVPASGAVLNTTTIYSRIRFTDV